MREEEKKRLVKLIEEAHKKSAEAIHEHIMDTVKTKGRFNSKTDADRRSIYEIEADYLLENGVIVQNIIKGYEDYHIDEYGNVYSLKSHRYINQQKGKDGYYYVNLCEDGKRKRIAVHRLVAMNFIENPSNLPMVNHKDENRENNCVENLEWCTKKYNTNYGNARIKQALKISKAVVCIETSEVFLSQKEAMKKKNIHSNHISDCCKGKKQTCGGYHWRFASEAEAEYALKNRRSVSLVNGHIEE